MRALPVLFSVAALLLHSSPGLLGEMQLNVPLCKSGFSQSLYSLRLSRDLVHGRSVLRG
ncbi:hypothetical protein AMELA_G00193160, partial [Ameiurus melas]